MADLLLHSAEQAALRELAATEPVPGVALPPRRVLALVTRLVPSDIAAGMLCTQEGLVEDLVDLPAGRLTHLTDLSDAVSAVGLCRVSRALPPQRHGTADALRLAVPNSHEWVAVLWLGRRYRRFRDEDVSMLTLLSPVLHRLLRERPVGPCPLR
jgi:hypothetical protein